MAYKMSSRRMRDLASKFNWERVFNWPGKVSASTIEFRADVGRVNADLEKYSKPPTPIDWEAYRKKLHDPSVVDFIKADYERDISTFRPAQVEDMVDVDAMEKEFKEMINAAVATVDESREEIRLLEQKLATLKRLYTTRETTIKDILDTYPEIGKEIDEEIANHEWDKGVIA